MSFEIIDIETQDGFQNVKIPKNLKIDDDKVYLKKVGNIIYVIPYHNAWENVVNATSNFSDDFLKSREQPPQQKRETFDE